MIRYVVESRDTASALPLAREWTVETIVTAPELGYRSRVDADKAIAEARSLGGSWARAEYRVRQAGGF